MTPRRKIPWRWRYVYLPLRERVWYPIKRWWYGMGPPPGGFR